MNQPLLNLPFYYDILFARAQNWIDHNNVSSEKISTGLVDLFFYGNRDINYPRFITLCENAFTDTSASKLFSYYSYLRSPRGGRGEKRLGRFMLQWLVIRYPELLEKYISKIKDIGRWDDYFYLFPGALNLTNLDYVARNYLIPDLTSEQLGLCKEVQKKIIVYVCDQILEDYKDYMAGRQISRLAKWLPTEQSSLDKKYYIVNTICEHLNLKPKTYRVVYLSPLRKALKIPEVDMCTKNWSGIDYSNVSLRCLSINRNSFQKHDEKRFAKWKKARTYYTPPHVLCNRYLTHNLEKKCPITEAEWLKIKLLYNSRTTTSNPCIIIADSFLSPSNPSLRKKIITMICLLSTKFTNLYFKPPNNKQVSVIDYSSFNLWQTIKSISVNASGEIYLKDIEALLKLKGDNYFTNIILIGRLNNKEGINFNIPFLNWNPSFDLSYDISGEKLFVNGFHYDIYYSLINSGEYSIYNSLKKT